MEQLKVDVNGDQKELTIRTGQAPQIQDPQAIKLRGDIMSIKAFLDKRYGPGREGYELQKVDRNRAVVIADKESLSILLRLDPQNVFGTEVVASLSISDELKEWRINSSTQFTREELVKKIRFNRRFFADALKHEELLYAYMILNITGTTELKAESDNRGNREAAFKKAINSQNIPTEFVLKMPIYKGQPEETFRVEVCLEATDASVRFWFESVELEELLVKRRDEIFEDQLKHCSDFVIINK